MREEHFLKKNTTWVHIHKYRIPNYCESIKKQKTKRKTDSCYCESDGVYFMYFILYLLGSYLVLHTMLTSKWVDLHQKAILPSEKTYVRTSTRVVSSRNSYISDTTHSPGVFECKNGVCHIDLPSPPLSMTSIIDRSLTMENETNFKLTERSKTGTILECIEPRTHTVHRFADDCYRCCTQVNICRRLDVCVSSPNIFMVPDIISVTDELYPPVTSTRTELSPPVNLSTPTITVTVTATDTTPVNLSTPTVATTPVERLHNIEQRHTATPPYLVITLKHEHVQFIKIAMLTVLLFYNLK